MDDLLRQSEQQARAVGSDGYRFGAVSWGEPQSDLTQPEPIGADAELSRYTKQVVEQLEWLKSNSNQTVLIGQPQESNLRENSTTNNLSLIHISEPTRPY